MSVEMVFKNNYCEWIDCENPVKEDFAYLHTHYKINPLLLEDTIDRNHLPKFEEDHDVKFFLTRENTELERKNLNTISDISTKLSIFIVENVIITIHRMKNRSIYEYRKEILKNETDATVDLIALNLAQKVLKSFDDESILLMENMDKMENEIFLKNTSNTTQIKKLYRLKRKAGLNSRLLTVSSEWVNNFKRLNLSEAQFTDLQDKYKDVVADFEHLTAQINNLISMFLAFSDQKANQVMKLLAIYSVYFLPITFIAGLYGMNFDNMPELHQKNAYYITLGVMAAIVIATFVYFRKKKW